MVDRIREIISVRQLTPTQFADTIGVARPIISHILSGRNKPSLEVVQKITAAFPDLSLPWLLSGAGPMNANGPTVGAVEVPSAVSSSRRAAPRTSESARPASAKAKTQPVAVEPIVRVSEAVSERSTPSAPAYTPPNEASSPPLFSASMAAAHSPAPDNQLGAPAPLASAQTAPIMHQSAANEYGVAAKRVVAADAHNADPATSAAASAAQPFAEPGKVIRRIVIFYQDGTFTDYQPENK